MDFFTRTITSKKVEEKGQSIYKLGKIFMFIGVIGFALVVLSLLIAMMVVGADDAFELLIFDIADRFAFMYPIMIISYLGILLGLIGVGLYFCGINLFALGRIVNNTEKE